MEAFYFNHLISIMEGNKLSEENGTYIVVVNHEEEYNILPPRISAGYGIPLGWKEAGFAGSFNACKEYIQEILTNQRPKSLRDAMNRMEDE